MIDREHRDRLAELIRHLANGRIPADSFTVSAEEFALHSEDPAVGAVYTAAWGLSGYEWILGGDKFHGRQRLPPQTRRKVAIWAVFLYSNTDYEWPDDECLDSAGDGVLVILCGLLATTGLIFSALSVASARFPVFGVACLLLATCAYFYSQRVAERHRERWIAARNRIGDYDVWPFLRTSNFQEARKHPRLLAGSSTNTESPREG